MKCRTQKATAHGRLTILVPQESALPCSRVSAGPQAFEIRQPLLGQILLPTPVRIRILGRGSNGTLTAGDPPTPSHTCMPTRAMRSQSRRSSTSIEAHHHQRTRNLRRPQLGVRVDWETLRVSRAMAQQATYRATSRAGVKRASTSSSHLRTGMANLKAAQTTLRQTCRKRQTPRDELHPRAAGNPSGMRLSGTSHHIRQWGHHQRLHSPKHKRNLSLTPYLPHLQGRLQISTFLLHRLLLLLGSNPPRSSLKSGSALSKNRAGFYQKRLRHVAHLRLRSVPKRRGRHPWRRRNVRKPKNNPTHRDPRSIKPRQMMLQTVMVTLWISTQARQTSRSQSLNRLLLRHHRMTRLTAQLQCQTALLVPQLLPLRRTLLLLV